MQFSFSVFEVSMICPNILACRLNQGLVTQKEGYEYSRVKGKLIRAYDYINKWIEDDLIRRS
jgi:hypothetical protein